MSKGYMHWMYGEERDTFEPLIRNEHRVAAFQMISPAGIGMSGFVEQLPDHPRWEEVVYLIAGGRIEEAQSLAKTLK
jgi:hypothetical protein